MIKNCELFHLNPGTSCADSYLNFCKETYKFKDCNIDTHSHIQNLKILLLNEKNTVDEQSLILLRCGLNPEINNSMKNFNICPKHRALLGINWISKKICYHPDHDQNKTGLKLDKRINFDNALLISKAILHKDLDICYKSLVLGSTLCYNCNKNLKLKLQANGDT